MKNRKKAVSRIDLRAPGNTRGGFVVVPLQTDSSTCRAYCSRAISDLARQQIRRDRDAIVAMTATARQERPVAASHVDVPHVDVLAPGVRSFWFLLATNSKGARVEIDGHCGSHINRRLTYNDSVCIREYFPSLSPYIERRQEPRIHSERDIRILARRHIMNLYRIRPAVWLEVQVPASPPDASEFK
jgi:hypothetical protein